MILFYDILYNKNNLLILIYILIYNILILNVKWKTNNKERINDFFVTHFISPSVEPVLESFRKNFFDKVLK